MEQNYDQKVDRPATYGDKWLNRFHQIIQENLAEGSLSNEFLATRIEISERHLFRRVKSLTGLTPQQYIRQCRLQQAMDYLEAGTYRTVKATATAVGFTNASHFINRFEKEFGKKPFDILRECGWR